MDENRLVELFKKKYGRQPTLLELEELKGMKNPLGEETQPPQDVRRQKLIELLQKKGVAGTPEETINFLEQLSKRSRNAFKLYEDLGLTSPAEDGMGHVFNKGQVASLLNEVKPAEPAQPLQPAGPTETQPTETSPTETLPMPEGTEEATMPDFQGTPPKPKMPKKHENLPGGNLPEPPEQMTPEESENDVLNKGPSEGTGPTPQEEDTQRIPSFNQAGTKAPFTASAQTSMSRNFDAAIEPITEAVEEGGQRIDEMQAEARKVREQSPEATLSGYSELASELIDQNKQQGKKSARQLLNTLDRNRRGDLAQGLIHALGKITSGLAGLATDTAVAKYYAPEKIFDRQYEDTIARQQYSEEIQRQRQDMGLRLNRAKELLNETMKYLDPTQKARLASQLKGLDAVSSNTQSARSNAAQVNAYYQNLAGEADAQRRLRALQATPQKPSEGVKLTAPEMEQYGYLSKIARPLTDRASPQERAEHAKKYGYLQQVTDDNAREAIIGNVDFEEGGIGYDPRADEAVKQDILNGLKTQLNIRASEWKRANPGLGDVPTSFSDNVLGAHYDGALNEVKSRLGENVKNEDLHRQALHLVLNRLKNFSVGNFRSPEEVMAAKQLGFDTSAWRTDEELMREFQTAPDRIRSYFGTYYGSGRAPQGYQGYSQGPQRNYPARGGNKEYNDGKIEGLDDDFIAKAGLTPKYLLALDVLDKYEGGINRDPADRGNTDGGVTVAGIASRYYKGENATRAFGENYPPIEELVKMYKTNKPLFNKYKAVYYHKNYWEPLQKLGIENYHPAVVTAVMDHQVNRGRLHESKALMDIASRYQDPAQQLKAIQNARSRIYQQLAANSRPDQQKFFKGWMIRASKAGNELLGGQ